MKSVTILGLMATLYFSFAARANQQTHLEAIRMLDGTNQSCTEDLDLRNRSYIVTNPQSSINSQTLTLTLTANSVQCKKSNQQFAWEAVTFGSPLRYTVPVDADHNSQVEVHYKSTEFLLMDASFEVLSVTPADENSSTLDLAVDLPRKTILSIKDELLLRDGLEVKKRFTLISRSLVSARVDNREEFNQGLKSGGSYTLFLIIKPKVSPEPSIRN